MLPRTAVAAAAAAITVVVYLRRRRRAESGSAPQQHHPSALRNRIPILKELLKIFPSGLDGLALELASGTGAHVEVFAPAFPQLTFQPSEYVPEVAAAPEEQWSKFGKIGLRLGLDELANIDAHACQVFSNAKPAVAIDLSRPWEEWPSAVRESEGAFALILCANTLHVTPWECSVGLLQSAACALAPGGHLVLYGPFKVNNEFIGADGGEGNAKFDMKLRGNNPKWGIRDVGDLSKVAAAKGLTLKIKTDMPANNLLLAFVKA
eukprot:TRINITY_DN65309_c0_g1_i1.p1 TRINITY_DN65309_c0_g1~~TRINITY_DN65309_c0_g1_i1.p1  ORF type:complete len:285 (-),score=42.07 TRINITY_DN65309_c0_g1_i1:81-872(-)